jgi:pyruvate decarboxylase
VGVESVHGVPGDYNLAALDYIEKLGLRWVGNANELNAGINSKLKAIRSAAK